MDDSTFKAWITKYALTQGIFEKEVRVCNASINGSMIEVIGGNRFTDMYHGEGKEWHRTKESAIQQAENMRQSKIASLEKQINKLRKLQFE